jgi:hypothetical protein
MDLVRKCSHETPLLTASIDCTAWMRLVRLSRRKRRAASLLVLAAPGPPPQIPTHGFSMSCANKEVCT